LTSIVPPRVDPSSNVPVAVNVSGVTGTIAVLAARAAVLVASAATTTARPMCRIAFLMGFTID
jgi:hypothetical protein